MNFVFSCPTSHPAPRWAAHGLVTRGHNVRFFTSSAISADRASALSNFPRLIRRELSRRILPDALTSTCVENSAVAYDLVRVVAERQGWMDTNMLIHRRMIARVQQRAMQYINNAEKTDAIFATGSMSPDISEYAYEKGIPLILYLPQPVMSYMDTIDSTQAKMMRPEEKIRASELMATSIFLASSRLVETSIRHAGIDRPIVRHPLGYPPLGRVPADIAARTRIDPQSPFKLLFIGRASYQKGLPTLLEGVRQLSLSLPVTLTVVTRETDKVSKLVEQHGLQRIVTVSPTMPKSDLFKLMRQHHTFILPSVFEGYGLVIVEALANGLPVITTALTAGSDLNIDEKAGLIIDANSTSSIVDAVKRIMENSSWLSQLSYAAESITHEISWDAYAENVSLDLELSLLQQSQGM